jgi:NF-X1-type zinc finger protein NFXL1
LNCGNHKCHTTCHAGQCYPCPLTVDVTCACGATKLTVPCGMEKFTKPPRCKKLCAIPPTCHHPKRKTHRCHFGPCLPCDFTCAAPLPDCLHTCPHPCHDPIPAIPTQQNAKGKNKKNTRNLASFPEPLPLEKVVCPPCAVTVQRWCLGQHELRDVICSGPREFSCGRACGNPLECGNHTCQLQCHVINRRRKLILNEKGAVTQVQECENLEENQDVPENVENDANLGEEADSTACENERNEENLEMGDSEEVEDMCVKCELGCQKPRNPPCPHPCTLPCHIGACPTCQKPVKKQCYCGSIVLTLACHQLTSPREGVDPLSCGQKCQKALTSCTHTCQEVCHAGPCPENLCKKRVVVKCPCKRIKKEMLCIKAQEIRTTRGIDVQSVLVLDCDSVCEEMKREREKQKELERIEKEKERERQLELEKQNTQETDGRRRRRQRKETVVEEPSKWRLSFPKLKLGKTLTASLMALMLAICVTLIIFVLTKVSLMAKQK